MSSYNTSMVVLYIIELRREPEKKTIIFLVLRRDQIHKKTTF